MSVHTLIVLNDVYYMEQNGCEPFFPDFDVWQSEYQHDFQLMKKRIMNHFFLSRLFYQLRMA